MPTVDFRRTGKAQTGQRKDLHVSVMAEVKLDEEHTGHGLQKKRRSNVCHWQ